MRVIAGTARHLPLKAPEGLETRPTIDRTKETLFNILQPYLAGSDFLDLFAGSGAIGIEALSRGARNCYFIEQKAEAQKCIVERAELKTLTTPSTTPYEQWRLFANMQQSGTLIQTR